MKITQQPSLKFRAESLFGEVTELRVTHTNRGEPYRDGMELSLDTEYNNHATLFLEADEARQLRDLLNRLYPRRPDVEPVTPTDLEELLKFAFTAGAGLIHPHHWDEETEKRWREFTPCPRSTYQRVEAAVYPEKKA